MRTTVSLDERLVHELMRFSIAKSKAEAVALAVKEQIRRAKLKTLADRLGSIEVDEKAFEEGDRAGLSQQ